MKSTLSNNFAGNIIPQFVLPKDSRNYNDDPEMDSARTLWNRLVHFLNGSYDGVHQHYDEDGNEWPEGSLQAERAGLILCEGRVRIVVFVMTGDLEYLANELKYPQFNSLKPGWFCPANRCSSNVNCLTDAKLDADWKTSSWSRWRWMMPTQ